MGNNSSRYFIFKLFTQNNIIMKTIKKLFLLTLLSCLCILNSCKKGEKPVVDFTYTGDGCTASCQVLFTNTTQNGDTFHWEFGDGQTSNEQSPPAHTYSQGGTYNVTLTATNEHGTASISHNILIQTAVNPCAAITCQNGGYCSNGMCICPSGYSGITCNQEVTPSSMRITKIVVTNFTNGGWDVIPASSPDIFVEVGTGTNCSGNLFTSSFYQDAYPGIDYDFIPSSPITVSNPSSPISICLYDSDIVGSDFMTGVNFIPYQSGANFPSVRTLTYNTFSCKVYLTYQW